MFRPNQIVIVDKLPCSGYPFGVGHRVLFLGEIVNMPEHCIIVDTKGTVHWGYHTDNFREPTEDEL